MNLLIHGLLLTISSSLYAALSKIIIVVYYKNYYIACGYTDLRRGIDGLAQIVTLQYGYEIDENSLFLFCGRRTDRIKALWFSGDGFVLLYKRLNNGSFQWPRSKDELKLLTPQSFRWLMEGLTTEPKKVIKKSRQKDMF